MSKAADLLNELRIDRGAPPPTSSRRGLWIALAIGAAVLLLAVGGWVVFGRDSAVEVKTAPVVAIGGGSGNASVLDATGYVVARRMATVSSKVTGKVLEVMIEEGQKVAAGDVMARLDPVDANAQRALAASQVAAARSEIGNVRAQLREAESNAVRMERLINEKLVSTQQYDQAIADRDALRARLDTAERNAQVAQSQLHITEQDVDNTVVRAPFSGVVIAKAAQPGEIVSPLSAGRRLHAHGHRHDRRYGFARGRSRCRRSIHRSRAAQDAGRGHAQCLSRLEDPAEVIAIIPAADRGKATVKVRIAIKVHDPRVVPDMGVRVSFLEPTRPAGAGGDAAGCAGSGRGDRLARWQKVAFVVSGDEVAQRAVKLGRTLGDDREVLEGLGGRRYRRPRPAGRPGRWCARARCHRGRCRPLKDRAGQP
jgi:RND family efflux transporter MFP subunit